MFSVETLETAVRTPSLAGAALTALAGALVILSPAALPAISAVSGATASDTSSRWQGLRLSSAFVLGMMTLDALIGAGLGVAGATTMSFLGANLLRFQLLVGTLLILLALLMWRKIHIPVPWQQRMVSKIETPRQAYLLGVPFGLLSCPACTPLLFPVAVGIAATANPIYGAALMAVFALGQGIPLIALGTGLSRVVRTQSVRRTIGRIELLGGLFFLAGGLYLLWTALRPMIGTVI